MEMKNQKALSVIRQEEAVDPKVRVVELEKENTTLRQKLAQFNGDFAAFIDFYFTKFPDQA